MFRRPTESEPLTSEAFTIDCTLKNENSISGLVSFELVHFMTVPFSHWCRRSGEAATPECGSKVVADADQCLVLVVLAAIAGKIGVTVFKASTDLVDQCAFNTAAYKPAVEVVRCARGAPV